MPKLLVQSQAIMPTVELPKNFEWTPSNFADFCRLNPHIDVELDSEGNIIIMSPANSDADFRNLVFTGQLWAWMESHPEFKVFGPTAGFTFPNDSIRSPDAAIVRQTEWTALSESAQKSFAPLVPLFVMELRSSKDDPISRLHKKMEMYISNGVQLGWLVDPITSELTIYRSGTDTQTLHSPKTVMAEDLLPDLTIDFEKIW